MPNKLIHIVRYKIIDNQSLLWLLIALTDYVTNKDLAFVRRRCITILLSGWNRNLSDCQFCVKAANIRLLPIDWWVQYYCKCLYKGKSAIDWLPPLILIQRWPVHESERFGYFRNLSSLLVAHRSDVFSLVISVYLSSLPVAHLSDTPRKRLVVTGDSARVQDETAESSAWFFNVLGV